MENTEGLFLKAGSSIICWNMFNDAHTNRALITSLIKLCWRVLSWNYTLTRIRFSLREVPVRPLGTVSQHFLHFCITSQWVHMKTLRFVHITVLQISAEISSTHSLCFQSTGSLSFLWLHHVVFNHPSVQSQWRFYQ